MTTKTSLLFPYDALNHVVCCKLHIRHAALTGAIYTLNISILVVLLYSWRVQVNIKRYEELEDVYYGVQIAYFAIIGTQLFMVLLSILLVIGILKLVCVGLLLASAVQAAFGFCPNGCNCDDDTLVVSCKEANLDVIPITLNPSIQRFVLKYNRIKTLDADFQFYGELQYVD